MGGEHNSGCHYVEEAMDVKRLLKRTEILEKRLVALSDRTDEGIVALERRLDAQAQTDEALERGQDGAESRTNANMDALVQRIVKLEHRPSESDYEVLRDRVLALEGRTEAMDSCPDTQRIEVLEHGAGTALERRDNLDKRLVALEADPHHMLDDGGREMWDSLTARVDSEGLEVIGRLDSLEHKVHALKPDSMDTDALERLDELEGMGVAVSTVKRQIGSLFDQHHELQKRMTAIVTQLGELTGRADAWDDGMAGWLQTLQSSDADQRRRIGDNEGGLGALEIKVTALEHKTAKGLGRPLGAWDWPEKTEKRLAEVINRLVVLEGTVAGDILDKRVVRDWIQRVEQRLDDLGDVDGMVERVERLERVVAPAAVGHGQHGAWMPLIVELRKRLTTLDQFGAGEATVRDSLVERVVVLEQAQPKVVWTGLLDRVERLEEACPTTMWQVEMSSKLENAVEARLEIRELIKVRIEEHDKVWVRLDSITGTIEGGDWGKLARMGSVADDVERMKAGLIRKLDEMDSRLYRIDGDRAGGHGVPDVHHRLGHVEGQISRLSGIVDRLQPELVETEAAEVPPPDPDPPYCHGKSFEASNRVCGICHLAESCRQAMQPMEVMNGADRRKFTQPPDGYSSGMSNENTLKRTELPPLFEDGETCYLVKLQPFVMSLVRPENHQWVLDESIGHVKVYSMATVAHEEQGRLSLQGTAVAGLRVGLDHNGEPLPMAHRMAVLGKNCAVAGVIVTVTPGVGWKERTVTLSVCEVRRHRDKAHGGGR